ncbi:hypothetical protein [Pseudonocardia sp. MH-G8]|uniref:hypothetical protein n=1 Tax=Pseudonocardia sp. MH-G8 TaxID=1854588 RepID=UPI000BA0A479|nr:hypothetical protein [Pseudonocardia sp. MH-G8]OZM80213.1 hypothetical protein CFP66_21945 [Pseudonocardia sp. MH-G8]
MTGRQLSTGSKGKWGSFMVEMVRPPRLTYSGVVTSDWASSVAQHLLYEAVTLADQNHLEVVEIWVSDDLSIYMRHVRAGAKLGLRVEELGVDPMVGTPARSSDLVGDSVYHSLYDTPPVRDWRDALGFEWWGDEPGEGWAAGVDRARTSTLVHRA